MKRQCIAVDASKKSNSNHSSDVGVAMSGSPSESGQKRRRVSFHRDDEIFHAASQVTEEDEEHDAHNMNPCRPADHQSWISKDELRRYRLDMIRTLKRYQQSKNTNLQAMKYNGVFAPVSNVAHLSTKEQSTDDCATCEGNFENGSVRSSLASPTATIVHPSVTALENDDICLRGMEPFIHRHQSKGRRRNAMNAVFQTQSLQRGVDKQKLSNHSAEVIARVYRPLCRSSVSAAQELALQDQLEVQRGVDLPLPKIEE